MEQPLRPGRNARQHEKPDQQKHNALKNWYDKTNDAKQDKTPTDDMYRSVLESRLCSHDDDNESLTDAVLARTEIVM
jgi:hypothetical protein